jgi:hypothetical protein
MAHFDSVSMASSVVSAGALEDEGGTSNSDSDLDDLETVIVEGFVPPKKESAKKAPLVSPEADVVAPKVSENQSEDLKSLVETLVEAEMGKKRGGASKRKGASKGKAAKKGKKGVKPNKQAQKKLQKFRKLATQMSSI